MYVFWLLSFVALFVLGYFLRWAIRATTENQNQIDMKASELGYYEKFYSDYNILLSSDDYIAKTWVAEITALYADVYSQSQKYLDPSTKKFRETYEGLEEERIKHNRQYLFSQSQKHHSFLSSIDGKALDQQQIDAVLSEEENLLVIAGAGCGKTLTIAARVKYLVECRNVSPGDILLLAFTNKAADEMRERLERIGIGSVRVSTFHSLGYSLLGQYLGYKPNVCEDSTRVISQIIKGEYPDSKEYLYNSLEYIVLWQHIFKEQEETGKEKGIKQYAKLFPAKSKKYYTLSGDIVRSKEEAIIANFLYLYDVRFEYEAPYKEQVSDPDHQIYTPDFYLPDYDVYLEHFGVNRAFRAPQYESKDEQRYLDGVVWKRNVHKKHGTTLLQSYSYWYDEGVMIQNLRNLLESNGIKLSRRDIPEEEIKKHLFHYMNHFNETGRVIQTFISLFKSNGFTDQEFNIFQKQLDNEAQQNHEFALREKVLLNLIRKVYEQYQNHLVSKKMIDFNDMINLASEAVEKGSVKPQYRYILIDEYQDMSMARFRLIKAIRRSFPAALFGVGDDWQSIYRFTGSELALFTEYEQYAGPAGQLLIEKTYRNSQELIETAGAFITQNPKQISKSLQSGKHMKNPLYRVKYYNDCALGVLKAINHILDHGGRGKEILIIGRNNFDVDTILGSHFRMRQRNGEWIIECIDYPEAKIRFSTAHRSKGTESDYIIIINLTDDRVRFPNKIIDDPLLRFVQRETASIPFDEERRLFYVALTRTRNSVYLVSPDNGSSVFVKELHEQQNIPVLDSDEGITPCPRCHSGILVMRKNRKDGSEFYGCSNFPRCRFTCSLEKYAEMFLTEPCIDEFEYE